MNPVSPLELLDSGKTTVSNGSAFSFDSSSVSQYLREVARDRVRDDSGVVTRSRTGSLPLSGYSTQDSQHERKRKIDRVLLGDMGPIPTIRRQLMSTTHSSDVICKTMRVEVYSSLDWQGPLSLSSTPCSEESGHVVSALRDQLSRKFLLISFWLVLFFRVGAVFTFGGSVGFGSCDDSFWLSFHGFAPFFFAWSFCCSL